MRSRRAVACALVSLAMGEQWAVIVDCGSTGSRLYAYHVGSAGAPYAGGVGVSRGEKVKPGLSSFAADAGAAVRQMAQLLRTGTRLVPAAHVASTRALLRCTGGVRDELGDDERTEFLQKLYEGLAAEDLPWRALERRDVGVVDGDDEAFYAFAAANFLERRVDHRLRIADATQRRESFLVGALDLGGSSTQITFPVSSLSHEAEEDDDDDRCVRGKRKLVTRSYAGVGAQAVRDRVLRDLKARRSPDDPCSHAGFFVDGHLPGRGHLGDCLAAIRRVVLGSNDAAIGCASSSAIVADNTSSSSSRKRRACTIPDDDGDVDASEEEPDPRTRFLAMCNFFYAADAIRALAPASAPALRDWPTPDLETLARVSDHYCALPWTEVNRTAAGKHPYTPDHLLPSRCFDAALILVLLRDVYALDDYPRVTFALDADSGVEVEWTLGYFLAEFVGGNESFTSALRDGGNDDEDDETSNASFYDLASDEGRRRVLVGGGDALLPPEPLVTSSSLL